MIEVPNWGVIFGDSMLPRWSHLVAAGVGPERVAEHARGSLVYLATPYSREVVGPDGEWQEWLSRRAYLRAAHAVAQLAPHGVTAVSPIVQAHAMCSIDRRIDPLDHDFWANWCAPLLAACTMVFVPDLPGWSCSAGIWHEVTYAMRLNRRVMFGARGL